MSAPIMVSEQEIQNQYTYLDAVSRMIGGRGKRAYTHTFGCQQNEADTERIRGMLAEMGYEMTDSPEEADFILFNTCAVREHAEDRAFGNIGALRQLKKQRPDIIIALCGCMAQQEKNVEKIKKSYPQVSLLFGTHALWRFPSLLYRVLNGEKRVFDIGGEDDIAEGLPVLREQGAKAWLSIMYGCNNFCTYCIVPYVRGRERSRRPEDIEKELRELVAAGYKDITLLGQNVNSYGKDLGLDMDFSDLLRRLNDVPGDFLLRFMTSHPKDASPKLFDTMADCPKIAKQLHLPFQSGSDAVLRRMNRRYTAEDYCKLIDYARDRMPDIVLSSDIIVGFPGEREEDFQQTLDLVRKVRFDLLFTFLYSKRSGTPAAEYDDPATPEEKQDRFARLLRAQDEIVAARQAAYMGRTLRVLVDGAAKSPEHPFTARTEGNLLVCVRGDGIQIGEFIEVDVEKTSLRCLFAVKKE
ncbi:MAG: tRNA (N6-isopentenyl adenosine(37)-C2)-methylthiotransferase MiaB [Agathobaculum sp.]|uniref:tRNA (N6-isopentenyl adenosine(37)-C2)-methylthiotransferase MiaB n=1 Tax=Agathobaculum sp. TaxID=2048138 RepID=UPI0025C27867|nr:tRNA (N6-isopentenyl adenosine(37)-C2)-methylthiotransferase MiaB [Agathobaculum sp.]MCI7124596.1 tRNA (N6-isopentenyl adenosine(37)-C2)-methylthiotransferase MiaB [Agathobaculum sp.]MDY3711003.1 tRNA (N6-isopentenyl adenosine(37)-C2)-methylthiotransferase MiaB [Agathobaculum sp.]